MAVNLDNIAEKIMKFIRGNGLDVKMFDSESGKSVADPSLARFFYVDEPNMMIVLDDNEKTIKFHMGEEVSIKHPMISKMHKNLKSMAMDHMLDFDIRSFGKRIEPKSYGYKIEQNKERDVDEVFESISPLEGSTRTSRQKLENAKIIVRHKKPVNEEVRGARSRNISAIFIENADGERFKYPFKHLSGARAMARHISTGGNPMDMAGSAIVEMSENLYKLKEFMNIVNKQRLVNETNRDVVLNVKRKMKKIKEQISQIQGSKGYTAFIESLALNEKDDEKMVCKDCGDEMGKPTTDCKHDCNDPNGSNWVKKSDISEEVLNDYVTKFTKSTFEEALKDILPLVHKVNEEEYNSNRGDQIQKIMGIITAKDGKGNKVNKISFPNRGSYDFSNIKKQYQQDKGSQYAKLAAAYEDLASRVDVDAADDKVRKNKGHDRAAVISLFLADIAEKLNSNPKAIDKQEQQLASYFMKMSKVAVGESLEEKTSLDAKISNMVKESFAPFNKVFETYQIDEASNDTYAVVSYDYSDDWGSIELIKDGKTVEDWNDYFGANETGNPLAAKFVELCKKHGIDPTDIDILSGDDEDIHPIRGRKSGSFDGKTFKWDESVDERKLTGGEKRSRERNNMKVNEIFGFGKKAQMRRGAIKIAKDVVIEQIIKPALTQFKGAFEGIDIVEDKAKDYIVTGYGFKIHLNVADSHLSPIENKETGRPTFYVKGTLTRDLDSTIKAKYKEWATATADDIYRKMITVPETMSTFEAKNKNKDGYYEQNIVIHFRILDGDFNKKLKKVNERKLTGGEKRSKESNFKKLKKHKGDFEKTYGKDAESVMHAVATKRAKEKK